MNGVVDQIITMLEILADKVPIELFAFIGSFVEELIGPIPSPLVLMTVGSIISVLNRHWLDVLFVTAMAALGKTLASYLYYEIADKTEDFVFGKYGRFLGVTHAQVESIGRYFNGTWKDDVVIILSRAIPFLPTTIVSLACGFIKMDRRSFLKATFIGYFIRCIMFIYLGYTGLTSYESFKSGTDSASYYFSILFAAILVIILIWLYFYSRRHSLKSLFKKFSS